MQSNLRERAQSWRTEAVEFLLAGGGTLLLLPLFWLSRRLFPDDAEWTLGFLAFHAAYVINDPHFSVTYLLFYRRLRERALERAVPLMQRLRYLWAGAGVPLLLVGWITWAWQRPSEAAAAESMGALFQLMFFLVSWHYVKQAFGILLLLSARRRVRFSLLERRLFLAHCITAWLYARATPFDPGSPQLEQGVFYHSLPHPAWLETATLAPFVLGNLGLVWAVASFYRRERTLRAALPLVVFLVSTWLWVVFVAIDPLLFYVVPALHSVQYLYVVYLERSGAARALEGPPTFGRPVPVVLGIWALSAILLGFLLFHGFPGLLDDLLFDSAATGPLGPTPFLAAFVALVNLHHYFMDAVIWRREVPEARALFQPVLAPSSNQAEEPAPPSEAGPAGLPGWQPAE